MVIFKENEKQSLSFLTFSVLVSFIKCLDFRNDVFMVLIFLKQ